MESAATDNPADILPRSIYYQVAHELRSLLPPADTDTPEDAAHREIARIARVAALCPANAEEAGIATQYVYACTQAMDCAQLTREYATDTPMFLKCAAQTASLMREARGWRALLDRTQAARRARQANPAEQEEAAATENRVLGFLAEALSHPAPAAPTPPPAPRPDVVAEAERYAQQHRRRAMLIRRFGRVPHKLNFGYLRPELVHTIATGDTPILRALDDKPKRAASGPA